GQPRGRPPDTATRHAGPRPTAARGARGGSEQRSGQYTASTERRLRPALGGSALRNPVHWFAAGLIDPHGSAAATGECAIVESAGAELIRLVALERPDPKRLPVTNISAERRSAKVLLYPEGVGFPSPGCAARPWAVESNPFGVQRPVRAAL